MEYLLAKNNVGYFLNDLEISYCVPQNMKKDWWFSGGTVFFKAKDLTTDLWNLSIDFNDLDTKILYADFSMDTTLVTDLELVCNKQFQVALVGSIYMVGLKNFIKSQCLCK